MATAHLVLGRLTAAPQHAYDLKKMHDQRFPHSKPVATGLVYATVQRLERLERGSLIQPVARDCH